MTLRTLVRDIGQALRGKGTTSEVLGVLAPKVLGGRRTSKYHSHGDFARRYTGWTFNCISRVAAQLGRGRLRQYSVPTQRELSRFQRGFGDSVPVSPARVRSLVQRNYVHEKVLHDGQTVFEIRRSPFLRLWRSPNPILSREDLMQSFATNLKLVGNHYTYLVTNGRGVPEELWPLPAHRIKIVEDEGDPVAGYAYSPSLNPWNSLSASTTAGGEHVFNKKDIMHVRVYNPLDPYGYGLGEVAANKWAIDTLSALDEYFATMVDNDAVPPYAVIPKTPRGDGWTNRFIALFRQQRYDFGPGSPLVVPSDVDIKPLGVKPSELAGREEREAFIHQIADGLGVPIALVTSKTLNRATMDSALYMLASMTTQPLADKIAEEINQFMMPLYADPGRLFVAFDNMVPEDRAALANEHQTYGAMAVLSINEIREALLLPSIGPEGDVRLVQQQMIPIGMAGETPNAQPANGSGGGNGGAVNTESIEAVVERAVEKALCACGAGVHTKAPPPPPTDDDIGNAGRGLSTTPEEPREQFVSGARRYFIEQERAVMEALPGIVETHKGILPAELQAKAPKREPFGEAWDAKLASDMEAYVDFEFGRGLTKAGKEIEAKTGRLGISFDVSNPAVAEAAKKHKLELSKNVWPEVNRTTARKVSRAISAGLTEGETVRQIADRVEGVFGEARKYRSVQVARTETARAYGAGNMASMKASGVVEKKEWLQGRGPCPDGTCDIDGEQVGLDEPFSNGVMHSPAHVNCTCDVAAVIEDEVETADVEYRAKPPNSDEIIAEFERLGIGPPPKTDMSGRPISTPLTREDKVYWAEGVFRDWSSGNHDLIREFQRTGKVPTMRVGPTGQMLPVVPEEVAELAERTLRINKIVEECRIKSSETCFRGLGFSSLAERDGFVRSLASGTMRNRAICSASTDEAVADKFLDFWHEIGHKREFGVVLHIEKAEAISIENFVESRIRYQKEVLIPKSKTFAVREIKEADGILRVYMEGV